MGGSELQGELRYEVDGPVARLTIDRPEKRNAMNAAVLTGLRDGLVAARDDDSVRVVVVTGAGDKAFCSGADLESTMGADDVVAQHEGRGRLAEVFLAMWSLGKPTVARVHGYALAGGFGLAMACDLVIATDDTRFGLPEIDVGLWPYMITVPLLRSFPPRVVLELMTTGRRMPVDEAARYGAVNRVVARAELDAAVDELGATLAAKAPVTMRYGLQSFRAVQQMTDEVALRHLQAQLTVTVQTEDTAEGLRAFLEKRPPNWQGK